jgi:hypothetical protein
MAVFFNQNVSVVVNSVDLSSLVTAVTINRQFEELNQTVMGLSGQSQIKGLEASSITIDFLNDTATSKTLQTLSAAWGTSVTVVVKQNSTAVSTTNPSYTMSCLINNTTDINGAVGDLGTESVTWNVNGTIAIATV